jgi:hypothetical protein
MKGRAITYSAEELAWVKACADLPRAEMHALFVQVFNRPEVSLNNLHALCKRNKWRAANTGHFAKGQTPHNKGKTMPSHPNSAAHTFKPGAIPPNRLPMWSERTGKDGYIEMKVPEVNPHTGHATRYRHKHRYLWEQKNGPLPPGMALKCLDGNKLNTDPSNWQAIPRALLPRLNGRFGRDYDTAPPELKPIILATAELEHAAREARKGQRHG